MSNNILKLLECGIDLVLLGGGAFRGKKWQDEDNLAQNDERMKAGQEDASFREDTKELFIEQMEIGCDDLFIRRMAIRGGGATENLDH